MPANECEVHGEIGHGKLLWEPLPVTNVNDGSV